MNDFSHCKLSVIYAPLHIQRLTEHAPLVMLQTMSQLHLDWVRRISYVWHNHSFISCSNSATNSLVMRDVRKRRKPYIFRVRKVSGWGLMQANSSIWLVQVVMITCVSVSFPYNDIPIPIQGVLCFDYSHQLEVLVTGSIDHLVRLWNPYVTSKPMAVLNAHSTAVLDVMVSSESGLVFSYSHDTVSLVPQVTICYCSSCVATICCVVLYSTQVLLSNTYIYTSAMTSITSSHDCSIRLSLKHTHIQLLCAWDAYEQVLVQKIHVRFPFSQRLPDYGPSVLTLHNSHIPTLVVVCNEYIAELKVGTVRAGLTAGEGVAVTSHTHSLLAAVYNPHLHQVSSVYLTQSSTSVCNVCVCVYVGCEWV